MLKIAFATIVAKFRYCCGAPVLLFDPTLERMSDLFMNVHVIGNRSQDDVKRDLSKRPPAATQINAMTAKPGISPIYLLFESPVRRARILNNISLYIMFVKRTSNTK